MRNATGSRPRSVYGRLLRYARPYRTRLIVGIVAGLLGGGSLYGLLNMAPAVLKPFSSGAAVAPAEPTHAEDAASKPAFRDLERLEAQAARFGMPVRDANDRLSWQALVLGLIALPLFVLLKSGANYVNRYVMRWVGARVVRDMRDDLFQHLQRQSLKFFGKTDVGRLISRCTNDATVVEGVIASTAADLTRAPIDIVASILFVLVFSVQRDMLGLVAIMLLVFPACIVPIVILGHFVRKHTRRALSRIADLVSRMHENFTGVRVVKAFNMEGAEIERFHQMNGSYFRSIIRALRAELLMTPLMEGVAILMACAFMIVCYARQVAIWEILPIGFAAVIIYRPMKQLARLNTSIQRGAAALERIFSILDHDTRLAESPHPVRIERFERGIAFEGVGFAYEAGGGATLKNIDVDIARGSIVALVGETGSGKTTMANLLARFYDPTEGRVLLDGVDLREIEVASLRRLIGVVTQETILFNDTIAANIAYGSAGATQAQIEAAARQANAHQFIVGDPAGYARVVGEKGFVLSGGERQRIALARAILKNPPILILDEATSALDTVTEHLVQEAIARVMKDRTVFAIAHRLSTVRHADQILLLDAGCILERGTHDELYRAGGHYRKLCDMQVLDS